MAGDAHRVVEGQVADMDEQRPQQGAVAHEHELELRHALREQSEHVERPFRPLDRRQAPDHADEPGAFAAAELRP